MTSTPRHPATPATGAPAAFLRGVERRAAVFAALQCGSVDRGDAAVAAALRAFTRIAPDAPMATWPVRFWSLLLAAPDLRRRCGHRRMARDLGVAGAAGQRAARGVAAAIGGRARDGRRGRRARRAGAGVSRRAAARDSVSRRRHARSRGVAGVGRRCARIDRRHAGRSPRAPACAAAGAPRDARADDPHRRAPATRACAARGSRSASVPSSRSPRAIGGGRVAPSAMVRRAALPRRTRPQHRRCRRPTNPSRVTTPTSPPGRIATSSRSPIPTACDAPMQFPFFAWYAATLAVQPAADASAPATPAKAVVPAAVLAEPAPLFVAPPRATPLPIPRSITLPAATDVDDRPRSRAVATRTARPGRVVARVLAHATPRLHPTRGAVGRAAARRRRRACANATPRGAHWIRSPSKRSKAPCRRSRTARRRNRRRLRAQFDALDPIAQRGWLLGPAIGGDYPKLHALLAQLPEAQHAPMLRVLRRMNNAERADLAVLAQRVPPQDRAGVGASVVVDRRCATHRVVAGAAGAVTDSVRASRPAGCGGDSARLPRRSATGHRRAGAARVRAGRSRARRRSLTM